MNKYIYIHPNKKKRNDDSCLLRNVKSWAVVDCIFGSSRNYSDVEVRMLSITNKRILKGKNADQVPEKCLGEKHQWDL